MHAVTPSDSSDDARLLTRVSSLAHRFARRLAGRDAADDLAQEVVLDCLVRLRSGRWCIDTTLEALVASMTWRQHAYANRRTTHRRAREARYLAECGARTPAWMDPARVLDESEESMLRERALAELPARCRAAWLLVREEGVTYRSVSRRLGISCGLVVAHVARAEQHLASRLVDPARWNASPPTRRRRARRRNRLWRARNRRGRDATTRPRRAATDAERVAAHGARRTSHQTPPIAARHPALPHPLSRTTDA